MALYQSDILIKSLRLQRGLTQKELSENICSQKELSRIENGKVIPNWYTFNLLMQKLGENGEKYFKHIVTADEKYALDKRYELEKLYHNFKFQEAREKLEEVKELEYFKYGFGRQFILWLESCLLGRIDKDFKKSLELCYQAINITKPDFDESNIQSYVLTQDEINVINLMAVNYYNTLDVVRTEKIHISLKTSLEKQYLDESEKIKTYIKVLYNLSKLYYDTKQFDKCLDMCETGIEISNQNKESTFLPLFLGYRAGALFNKGEIEESKNIYRQVLAILDAQERHFEIEQLKVFYKDELQLASIFYEETPQRPL